MPKLGPIQIDNSILDAIRDDRLVIFAGAGVSMGPPANLPDFGKLANDIAAGTSLVRAEKEPVDRFLGRLKHTGVEVHQRAKQRLSNPTSPVSAPTALHFDLTRLYRNPESLRLVTTNFDLHFEAAAQTIFGRCPDVYRAPALPLGRYFRGLVHVHGALTHPPEMILTDADFGRGYLTEGWARRFLVDVFRTYPVLFVGYSHSDVVMNYLARALPADGVMDRYALTEEDGDWRLLGITPIPFRKGTGENVYQELYDGVRCLAERAIRGPLDWQSKLAEIGSQAPPADDETIGEIKQALREVHTTRFLVNVARRPEWPTWLDAHKQLDTLFDNAPLNERDGLLAVWLAEHYSIDHADELMGLISAHDMRLNPCFWRVIGQELGLDDKKPLSACTLSRWVSVLLTCAPTHADPHVLESLATRCAKQDSIHLVMEVFLFMSEHRLTVKPGFDWWEDEGKQKTARFDVQTPLRSDHHNLNMIWENHLKPNLAAIVQPLLSGVIRQLEKIHHTFVAWNKASRDGGETTWNRSAIEPHEQDKYAEPIDVLIDTVRDALEWLATHQLALFETWMERLVVSDVPLLRRLAIHALTVHPDKSPDESLRWVMTHVGLHARAELHEVYRAVALVYPSMSSAARQIAIEAILQYQFPNTEDSKAADRMARTHFDWLDWLHQSDPSCALARAALVRIKAAHPDWIPRDYPDLTYWTSSGFWSPRSPWTAEQLLTKAPAEQLDDLLSFKGNPFDGPDRDGLCSVIREACKRQSSWAFLLDTELSESALWDSDLWSSILRGLQEAELALDDWKLALNRIARHELHVRYAREITDLLRALVRDGGKPFTLELLEQANIIAFNLWQSLSRDDEEDAETDWLSMAINRPAGLLVEFWIKGLSLRLQGKHGDERTLPIDYREWFTAVVQDKTIVGGMGRSMLASQIVFLFALDEEWTHRHIIPLFSSPDSNKFKQTWDGFLVWGQLNNLLIEVLQPAFLSALQRLDADLAENRRRFIKSFTALVVLHVDDPTVHLLPALFESASLEDRNNFASQLKFFLQNMAESTRQNLWERWLRRYWQNRLQSVPRRLEETEAKIMLEWLPHLGELFPQGVSLAVSAQISQIDHTSLIYKMQKSDLVTRFPMKTAELLVFLCSRVPGYHGVHINAVARRLPVLDPELRRKLDESMARAGFA